MLAAEIAKHVTSANLYAEMMTQEQFDAACAKVEALIAQNGGAECEGCEKHCADAAVNTDVSSEILILCAHCSLVAAGKAIPEEMEA